MDEDPKKVQWPYIVLSAVVLVLLGALYMPLSDKPDVIEKVFALFKEIIPNLMAALIAILVVYVFVTARGIESHSPLYLQLRQAVKEGALRALFESHAKSESKFTDVLHILFFESLIQSDCRPFDYDDEFSEYLQKSLFDSDTSYHVMSATKESISNYYSSASPTRGLGWKENQLRWISENPQRPKPMRIFLCNSDEFRGNEKFRNDVVDVIRDLDTYCDLMIVDLAMHKDILPRDFGVFANRDGLVSCVFTYTPLSRGSFSKLTSGEYGTQNENIHHVLSNYFFSMWRNQAMKLESDRFRKLWRTPKAG